MQDFMRLYSGLVERCFDSCANDFTSKTLTNNEVSYHILMSGWCLIIGRFCVAHDPPPSLLSCSFGNENGVPSPIRSPSITAGQLSFAVVQGRLSGFLRVDPLGSGWRDGSRGKEERKADEESLSSGHAVTEAIAHQNRSTSVGSTALWVSVQN